MDISTQKSTSTALADTARVRRPLVFLDIDDVLRLHPTLNARQALAAILGDQSTDPQYVWQNIFHAAASENLRLLDLEFSPLYVISSSWTGRLNRDQICETFTRTGLQFVANNLHERWCTLRWAESSRFAEIHAWLDANWLHSHKLALLPPFVILDDVRSGASLIGSHLHHMTVLCNEAGGFMFPQLRTAQHILRAPASEMP